MILARIIAVVFLIINLEGCGRTSHENKTFHSQVDLEIATNKGDSDEKLVVTPEDLDRPIIESISLAQKNIDLANFHLSNLKVVEALISAASRGVKIRLILDANTLTKSLAAQKIADQLRKNAVQVKASSKFFSITHEKSFVIDSSTAFISSINLVTTTERTRDFGLFTHDESVIHEMNSVFEADWANADSNEGITPPLRNERLVWSPVNSLPKLKDLILSAKKDIKVMVENLGDEDIHNAFIEKAKEGIHIQILTPGCLEGNALRNRPFIKTLMESQIENKVSNAKEDPEHPYIHAKMILVDEETFYIGSENYSYNSLVRAREVGIITHDKNNAEKISKVFDHDWANGTSPDAVTLEDCLRASQRGPALAD